MIILKGRVTVESNGDVFPTLLFNPTLLQLTAVKTGTGKYQFTSDVGLFNSETPPKWYIANSQGIKYVVAQTSRNTFEINVYDGSGLEDDYNLSGVEFEIDL